MGVFTSDAQVHSCAMNVLVQYIHMQMCKCAYGLT